MGRSNAGRAGLVASGGECGFSVCTPHKVFESIADRKAAGWDMCGREVSPRKAIAVEKFSDAIWCQVGEFGVYVDLVIGVGNVDVEAVATRCGVVGCGAPVKFSREAVHASRDGVQRAEVSGMTAGVDPVDGDDGGAVESRQGSLCYPVLEQLMAGLGADGG